MALRKNLSVSRLVNVAALRCAWGSAAPTVLRCMPNDSGGCIVTVSGRLPGNATVGTARIAAQAQLDFDLEEPSSSRYLLNFFTTELRAAH